METKKALFGYDLKSFLETILKNHCKIIYFHNLKFDGTFLLNYFLEHNLEYDLIAPNGVWFSLEFKGIQFRDSLKKFKMTVDGLSLFLGLERKKTDLIIDEQNKKTWDKYIPLNYIPTKNDIDYCIHDSIIVAYAIEKEWDNGRRRLTQSSESYNIAKKKIKNFDKLFPKLSAEHDLKVRKTYKGGFCSVNPDYQGIDIEDVYAYDVNGLYGWSMDKGRIPVGQPYNGEPVSNKDVCFIDFFCEFDIKDKMLPILQIKHNSLYAGCETEYLTESNGITHLFLTDIDYEMFKKHYHIYNDYGYEYLSFRSQLGLLSPIIKENLEQKEYYSNPEHYDEYLRQVAKDNTNMLYGSFGLALTSDKLVPYLDEDGVINYTHIEEKRQGRYIPVASYITATARQKTITAIQKNYKNWIYSDTDSMYLTKPAVGIEIDNKKSGYWDFETMEKDGKPYKHGKFLRQKTYCLADENYNIYSKYDKYGNFVSYCKCAGLSDTIKKSLKWEEFYLGANLGKRLVHTTVKGGVCLVERDFRLN